MKISKHIVKLVSLSCASVLLITAAMTSCGDSKSAKDDKKNSSSSSASSTTSSDGFVIDKDGYVDVKASGGHSSASRDNSKYFPEKVNGKTVTGYIVNDGVYPIDEETLYRVLKMKFKGNGAIKWRGFQKVTNNCPHQFDGTIPVSKVNDELFVSMNLPNECSIEYDGSSYKNGRNMAPVTDKIYRINCISAISLVKGKTIADDAKVTICLSGMNMLFCTKDGGWTVAQEEPYPKYTSTFYGLPWQEHGKWYYNINDSQIKRFDDHVEIEVTGADFNATAPDTGLSNIFKICTFHFFNSGVNLPCNDDNFVGVAGAFKAWIKEPELAGYFATSVGADLYGTTVGDDGKTIVGGNADNDAQLYTSPYVVLNDKPRDVVGHTIANDIYDQYVPDSDKILKMLKVK